MPFCFWRQDGGQDISAFQPNPVIARDGRTEITLDWGNIYGSIPPGDYVLRLKVSDVYAPEHREPDTASLEARQTYDLPFTVAK